MRSEGNPPARAGAPEMPGRQALAALRGQYPEFVPGEVWLVGAGPGDPGLLTLDALAGLLQADVVVHDALVDARVLALARSGAQILFAGKRGGRPSTAQEDISAQLIALARGGLRVLRLKGGDPFVFGRGGEEILALAAAGVPFRVIPGVTAGLSGLASACIPATMRGVNQAIILATGHGPHEEGAMDWSALARTRQPIVLYMGLRNLENIAAALMRGGLPGSTPAAVIASATLAGQQVLVSRLECIASDARAAKFAAPAIVVIGDIVHIRQQLLDASAHNTSPAPDAGAALPRGTAPCEGQSSSDPERDRNPAAYRSAVTAWHEKRAALYAHAIREELSEDECGAFLVWGDPSLYDSTLRIIDQVAALRTVDFEWEIIPGITSIQALAARHRISLNEIGEPVHITTGRRLTVEQPADGASVLVLLDGQ